jgi:hypothetical protein
MPVNALRALTPFRLVLAVSVVLAATGCWLHWTPRFGGLPWGLTELAHTWIGWGSLALLAGYLIHHLRAKWGRSTKLQRGLGWALAGVASVLSLTGVMLAIAWVGGPPDLVLRLHFVGTFVLAALLLWHTSPPWRRWLKRT